jgi:glycosyltransferase involved in cell wall biosynthesis
MKCTIVVPFHNEEKNVTELYSQINTVIESLPGEFELVFVDDGSTDATVHILNDIVDVDERVTLVQLRRNYGQTEALAAGFTHATGDYIIAMDGDLQHNPEDIPLFLEKLEQGYDVVSGCRIARPGDNVLARQIPSRIANWAMAKATGLEIRDFGSGYKAFRGELVRGMPLYGQVHRFIPALASAYGARICEIPIRISERRHGKSHYGLGRLFPVFFDLLTIPFLLRYASRPMHFFGKLGIIGLLASFSIALYLLITWLAFGSNLMTEHGPLMIFAVALMVAALQLISLGFIGEMMTRNHHQGSEVRRESEVLRVTRHRA